MAHFFQIIFYQPILNLLIYLYNTVAYRDLGVAILILTILIRLILWPLSQKSIKSQKALQELQPKINEIKKKYPDNKQEQGQAMIDLYKNNNVNPFSSCLPLLIQLPFLIAVFQVFRDGLTNHLTLLYPFVANPGPLNTLGFGFLDLSKANIYLAVLAGLAQFVQAKMMLSKQVKPVGGAQDEDMPAIMNKQMLFFMPALTIFIGFSMPGGLTFYWFLTTALTVLQQLIIFKKPVVGTIIEGQIVEKK
jgi:YidC/Oxa1 family membrane protein insertase